MNSRELVFKTMRGENPGRTPLYGWVRANLKDQLTQAYGSVEAFEDHYRFDLAHIFGTPNFVDQKLMDMQKAGEEVTPDMVLDSKFTTIDRESDYTQIINQMAHHHQRDRFCYIQTNGIFEAMNRVFGIENHLLYLALYPDEIKELYSRLADWNIRNAENLIDLGADGIHVSDDWGAQKAMMFSPAMYKEMIYPCHKRMVQSYKKHDNILVSLHSDGCIAPALDCVADIGYDFIHPWQENCGMPYSLYLDRYQDKFGIMGGLCVQSTLGYGDYQRLESEIRRVFGLLKGKRWACCTTHFVQSHCSLEELVFAYDLMRELCDKESL